MLYSGAKVKRFLPILEAAAGGKLDSKWYHRRSLESVDFKSCGFLTDVDVNALCVLHSRVKYPPVAACWCLSKLFLVSDQNGQAFCDSIKLFLFAWQLEDVNLANCCGISDVALTVLSRYQQSKSFSGDSTPEGSAKLLEETEESSMPVIQGSEAIREDPDNFWPELSLHAQSKVSSKFVTGDGAWGRSQSVGLAHSPPETSDRASVDVIQNSKITKPTPPSRSYAQAALKAVGSSPLMVLSNTFGSNVDTSSPLALSSDTTNFVDTTVEGVALPHIDWTSVQIPSRTVDRSGSNSNDSHLKFLRAPTPGDGLVVEDPKQGKLDFTRKKKGNKGYLVDAENSRTALPERMDALQLDSATKRDFLLRDDLRLPSSRTLDKVVVDDDGKGTNYYSLDFESSGDPLAISHQSGFLVTCLSRSMLSSHLMCTVLEFDKIQSFTCIISLYFRRLLHLVVTLI